MVGVPIHEAAACHLEQLVDALGELVLPSSTVLAIDVNNSSPLFYEQVQRMVAHRLSHLSPMIHYEPTAPDEVGEEEELHLVFRPGSGHGAMVEGGGVKARRITEARERLRGLALSLGVDYIYWCDSDMVPPADTLSELLATGRKYVAARCHVRQSDPPAVSAWRYESPNIYDDGQRVTVSTRVPNELPVGQQVFGGSLPLSNLMGSIVYWHGDEGDTAVEVDGVGMAATLVHRDIFSQVDFDTAHQLADDAQFALKAKEEGFSIWLHPGVFVPHVDEDGTVY
jgi:GT2 family glycosyltransferase